MTNKRALTTAEVAIAKRIKALIAADPTLTEEAVGIRVGVSQGMVSHWSGGRNAVPATRAAKLTEALGIPDPGEVSLQYKHIQSGQSTRGDRVGESDPLPYVDPSTPDNDLAILQAQIEAQHAVLAVLIAVACAHRPIEGADLARRLRKHVSPKLLREGFVQDILQTLDKVAAASAQGRTGLNQGGKANR